MLKNVFYFIENISARTHYQLKQEYQCKNLLCVTMRVFEIVHSCLKPSPLRVSAKTHHPSYWDFVSARKHYLLKQENQCENLLCVKMRVFEIVDFFLKPSLLRVSAKTHHLSNWDFVSARTHYLLKREYQCKNLLCVTMRVFEIVHSCVSQLHTLTRQDIFCPDVIAVYNSSAKIWINTNAYIHWWP